MQILKLIFVIQIIINSNLTQSSKPKKDTEKNPEDVCDGVSQGILSLVNEHNNLDDRTVVTAVLNKEGLKLLKGNEEFKKLKLSKILPPILILPDSNECLKIHSDKEPLILCSFNEYSRNAWWLQLTKQILCNNRGKARNEVYGDSSIEEQAEDLEHIFNKDDKTGINIHIDGNETELPQIKVHYKG
ncbi:serine/threonine protein kinase [Theileria orientalis strain Shintoku]|uniref:Serine/threonine protein kinase n=1 Tax=Theileria orientalis strain Shintoku TaxID=869250 RepID=J4D8H0_THEOR|nr:serine/threonine protein kinase [Theileria orientalis strain Shintoku]BAM40780.1 serine/threonine protein kinase [Theileria orientalis strain Shintoku]|eukprot:XP_009691081.1 serine/threonine protein kinase [Theileria orientalis strain Shintoku]